MKKGDREMVVYDSGFREPGVVIDVDHNDQRFPYKVNPDDGTYQWYPELRKIKPLTRRSWTTTQADIDCQGKY